MASNLSERPTGSEGEVIPLFPDNVIDVPVLRIPVVLTTAGNMVFTQ